MNPDLRPPIAQALAPYATVQRPVSTTDLCKYFRAWADTLPNHRDLSAVLTAMTWPIAMHGSLTDKCAKSLNDQLMEMAGEVEQDEVNQREQV